MIRRLAFGVAMAALVGCGTDGGPIAPSAVEVDGGTEGASDVPVEHDDGGPVAEGAAPDAGQATEAEADSNRSTADAGTTTPEGGQPVADAGHPSGPDSGAGDAMATDAGTTTDAGPDAGHDAAPETGAAEAGASSLVWDNFVHVDTQVAIHGFVVNSGQGRPGDAVTVRYWFWYEPTCPLDDLQFTSPEPTLTWNVWTMSSRGIPPTAHANTVLEVTSLGGTADPGTMLSVMINGLNTCQFGPGFTGTDYSYESPTTPGPLSAWDHVTIYVGKTLVWGVEPTAATDSP